MKTRWMKSVIATSGEAAPALPFQRGMRNPARRDTCRRQARRA